MTKAKDNKYKLIMRDSDGNEQLIAEGKFTSVTVETADRKYIDKWRDFIKQFRDGHKERR